MIRYCLNEDIRLEKLPVRYSDELKARIEDVVFYNKFESENINQWVNDLKGIVSWLSNPAIAWDNQNEFIHYDDGEIYIKKYGILFEILNYIDVLVDGKYVEDKHDRSLAFRGSSNQNIIPINRR